MKSNTTPPPRTPLNYPSILKRRGCPGGCAAYIRSGEAKRRMAELSETNVSRMVRAISWVMVVYVAVSLVYPSSNKKGTTQSFYNPSYTSQLAAEPLNLGIDANLRRESSQFTENRDGKDRRAVSVVDPKIFAHLEKLQASIDEIQKRLDRITTPMDIGDVSLGPVGGLDTLLPSDPWNSRTLKSFSAAESSDPGLDSKATEFV
eukprot:1383653-Amorphochlora_amoeboformis.AAC.1